MAAVRIPRATPAQGPRQCYVRRRNAPDIPRTSREGPSVWRARRPSALPLQIRFSWSMANSWALFLFLLDVRRRKGWRRLG